MSNIVVEDMIVPSEPGIDIYVRNKRPADLTSFTPERTVLFVHGSTYPAHTGFDIPLGGQSWMDFVASHGNDVYCLDVRGYGRSTRQKAMDEPMQNNPPVSRTPDAVKDVTAVLNMVLKRRNIPRLNLIGWSWGCALMATTTIQNPDKVARLVLYAPGWLRTTPSNLMPKGGGPLGAYRTVTPRAQAGGADPARLVRAVGRLDVGHRSGGREAEPAGGARAKRHGAGLGGVLDLRQNHVGPREHHRADADRNRRVGRGHAALHGAGDLPADGELARQAAGDGAGGHSSHDAGEESQDAVPRRAKLPR
jgi:pimeloyl-ACP methyl ester carboxylesterase